MTDEEWEAKMESLKPWRKIKTNADRIRGMSDEELARFFLDFVACDDCPVGSQRCKREFAKCLDAALDWLRSPVEDIVD